MIIPYLEKQKPLSEHDLIECIKNETIVYLLGSRCVEKYKAFGLIVVSDDANDLSYKTTYALLIPHDCAYAHKGGRHETISIRFIFVDPNEAMFEYQKYLNERSEHLLNDAFGDLNNTNK